MALYSLSICTGVGGLDLGIELAAPGCFTPIALCEGEAYAAAILAARMEDKTIPSAPIWSDVRTLCNAEFGAYVRARTGGQGIDAIWGGIPCQPHSVAGKQLGADDPRDLWPDTVRILEKYKPWLFFLENVPGMLDVYAGVVTATTGKGGQMNDTLRNTNWTECAAQLPPDGEVVQTIISDYKGKRNEGPLKRQGNLWFMPDGSMYVYYTPTHWRSL